MSDRTLDPGLTSWVPIPADSDFPIQNLPFGVFSTQHRSPRVGVAIGDHIVDLVELSAARHLDRVGLDPQLYAMDRLNHLIAAPEEHRRELRSELSGILSSGSQQESQEQGKWLVSAAEAHMHLPVEIGDYVDFYSSIDHATNLGRIFRPDGDALLPNYRHLPIGYHARVSTIVVSGTDITRPSGQGLAQGEPHPTFGPSRRLDFELEVGFITNNGPPMGSSIALTDAESHIFGVVIVNDWTARDLQAWEYVPLGPFLGKSFATTISPWVVTMAALDPFRTRPPEQHPEPLPYLGATPTLGLDIDLQVEVNGTRIGTTGFAGMYWTQAQQLTHAASNGTAIRAGDLYASGTVSGSEPGSMGSLIETSWNGTRPITLLDGSTRTFLEDGDRVVMRGRCSSPGAVAIGFGECVGRVVPAIP